MNTHTYQGQLPFAGPQGNVTYQPHVTLMPDTAFAQPEEIPYAYGFLPQAPQMTFPQQPVFVAPPPSTPTITVTIPLNGGAVTLPAGAVIHGAGSQPIRPVVLQQYMPIVPSHPAHLYGQQLPPAHIAIMQQQEQQRQFRAHQASLFQSAPVRPPYQYAQQQVYQAHTQLPHRQIPQQRTAGQHAAHNQQSIHAGTTQTTPAAHFSASRPQPDTHATQSLQPVSFTKTEVTIVNNKFDLEGHRFDMSQSCFFTNSNYQDPRSTEETRLAHLFAHEPQVFFLGRLDNGQIILRPAVTLKPEGLSSIAFAVLSQNDNTMLITRFSTEQNVEYLRKISAIKIPPLQRKITDLPPLPDDILGRIAKRKEVSQQQAQVASSAETPQTPDQQHLATLLQKARIQQPETITVVAQTVADSTTIPTDNTSHSTAGDTATETSSQPEPANTPPAIAAAEAATNSTEEGPVVEKQESNTTQTINAPTAHQPEIPEHKMLTQEEKEERKQKKKERQEEEKRAKEKERLRQQQETQLKQESQKKEAEKQTAQLLAQEQKKKKQEELRQQKEREEQELAEKKQEEARKKANRAAEHAAKQAKKAQLAASGATSPAAEASTSLPGLVDDTLMKTFTKNINNYTAAPPGKKSVMAKGLIDFLRPNAAALGFALVEEKIDEKTKDVIKEVLHSAKKQEAFMNIFYNWGIERPASKEKEINETDQEPIKTETSFDDLVDLFLTNPNDPSFTKSEPGKIVAAEINRVKCKINKNINVFSKKILAANNGPKQNRLKSGFTTSLGFLESVDGALSDKRIGNFFFLKNFIIHFTGRCQFGGEKGLQNLHETILDVIKCKAPTQDNPHKFITMFFKFCRTYSESTGPEALSQDSTLTHQLIRTINANNIFQEKITALHDFLSDSPEEPFTEQEADNLIELLSAENCILVKQHDTFKEFFGEFFPQNMDLFLNQENKSSFHLAQILFHSRENKTMQELSPEQKRKIIEHYGQNITQLMLTADRESKPDLLKIFCVEKFVDASNNLAHILASMLQDETIILNHKEAIKNALRACQQYGLVRISGTFTETFAATNALLTNQLGIDFLREELDTIPVNVQKS